MTFHNSLDVKQFVIRKPSGSSEPHGPKPVFRRVAIPLDVNMARFRLIARVKEKPAWADERDSWHGFVFLLPQP